MENNKTATGLDMSKIGKTYSAGPFTVTEEEIIKYAMATNDPNDWYINSKRDSGIIAPPIYPVKLLKEVMFYSLLDREIGINFFMLVHSSQDMILHFPIKPGDVVKTTGEIIGMTEKSSGDILTVRYQCIVNGKLGVDVTSGFFIRLPKNKIKKKNNNKPASEKETLSIANERNYVFSFPMTVDKNQTFRYAEASGDNNPIHVDNATAKMVGLPGIILQGLCTMAFASRAVVQEASKGNPLNLKRISVNFSNIVLPEDQLITKGWLENVTSNEKIFGFEMFNQSGKKVLSNGKAILKI